MKKQLFLALALLGGSSSAFAADCELNINVQDAMTFDKPSLEISLAKCDNVTLKLKHEGKMPKTAMGHNWVLTTTADQVPVASAGVTAGAANNYTPVDDKRVIAGTEIIGGGEETSITFSTKGLKVGGDYTYFCSFPGHSFLMKGKFIVK
ncbi:azurin [Parashewanella curva]|uniref:Azurin n=1 Tax=Parashewanella curva TaxID=2338552 RepID=A0A3L8PVR1_9GAMM|nr:azurin [Parashewanella curva]RLV58869.1 azurin [Parashewanella curva]